MCRFQEHYESPFEEIRGKVFTLGQLKQAYCDKKGSFTYFGGSVLPADWSGYNFPSWVLEPFNKGLFDPLQPEERDIVEALRAKSGRFYVIGTFGEGDTDPRGALDHEICHALYYVNPEYKKEVDSLLAKANLAGLKSSLIDWGYSSDEQILLDECHAYLSADYQYLIDLKATDGMLKKDLENLKPVHVKLRKIKAKYGKEILEKN